MKTKIAKYYFSIAKDRIQTMNDLKLRQSPVNITKISPESNTSVINYKLFNKHMEMKMILTRKRWSFLNINNNILRDFGWLNHKIKHNELIKLTRKYSKVFDCIDITQNSDGTQHVDNYTFNLYELEHYKIMPELVNRYWLTNCFQLTIGWYIHDIDLYNDFMQYWYPSKVKDLKIIHYEYMGDWTKIWRDPCFRK